MAVFPLSVKMVTIVDPHLLSSMIQGLILETEAEKSIHLNELDVRKP
jgi:hypothetical protein